MAESVPADSFVNADCARNRLDVRPHEIVRPVRLLAPHRRTGEDPIIGDRIRTLATPFEILGHVLIQGDGLGGGFGFAIADDLMPIERVTGSSRFSKSTSRQRSANSSLARGPVAASSRTKVRSRTNNLLRRSCNSASSRTPRTFSRFGLWRTQCVPMAHGLWRRRQWIIGEEVVDGAMPEQAGVTL
jgi:hypothetical protein